MPEGKLTEYQRLVKDLNRELAKLRRQIDSVNKSNTELIARMAAGGADTLQRAAEFNKQIAAVEALIKKEYELLNLRGKIKQESKGVIGGFSDADIAAIKTEVNTQVNQILDGVKRKAGNVRTVIPGGADTPENRGKYPTPDPAVENQIKKEEALAKKYGATLESVQSLRERFLKDPRFSKAQAKAQEFGFDLNKDLYRIKGQGTGVQQLQLANEVNGVSENLSLFVDKVGNVIPSISRQFRTFSQGVVRDIGELAKWTIAMSVIYTPIQQLSNLMSQMVENQTKLADAQVAINSVFVDSGDVFDVASEAAKRSGEAVGGVIDAFTQAYKATGSISNQQERFVTSSKLLNDSLVLSKLSALDQAQAIDTLTAALLQSGSGLDEGAALLNKWVRVSQIAYVGIDALATGVAVLGDSAETVGLSIDDLNGLIAVLAQTSISGSKEVANTAKTLIGSYQSDKAATELRKFGIAVTSVTGEARPFLEVIRDLNELSTSGVISEQQLARISLALGGGGTRRAKDVQALISNYDRLNQISEESSKITGSSSIAQEALAKKLNTVQTSATQLSNAFQSLAQTLGTDGGLLDLFKGLIDLGTGLVTILDRVTEALGKAGPLLYTFGIASLIFRNKQIGGIPGSFLSNTQGSFLGQAFGGGNKQQQQLPPGMLFAPQYAGGVQAGGGAGIGGLLTRALTSSVVQSTLLAGIPAYSNAKQGDYEEAGANVVGGIIGAFVGGPAGALVGASIAEAFVRSTLTYETDFQNLFKGAAAEQTPAGETATGQDQFQQAVSRTFQEYGRVVLEGAGGGTPGREYSQQQLESIGKANAALNTFAVKLESFFTGKDVSQLTPERLAFKGISESTQQQIELLNKIQEIQSGNTNIESPLNRKQTQLFGQDQNLLSGLRKERYNQLIGQVTGGEIRPSAFQQQIESIGTFEQRGTRFMAAFGEEFKKLAPDITTTTEEYQAFLDIITYGSEEQSQAITGLITDINTLQTTLESWDGTLPITLKINGEDITFENVAQLQDKLGQITTEAAGIAAASYSQIRLDNANLPQIVGDVSKPYTSQETQDVAQRARALQEEYLSSFLSPDLISEYNSKLEDFTVLVSDAGKKHFEVMSEIDKQFWSAAQKQLDEEGKLTSQQGGIGFQNLANFSRAQIESAAQKSLALGAQWQSQFGYDYKPTTQVVAGSEGLNLAKPLKADFKIMQLLLQELVDQGQKQLDGQYNIPEGATFWVPLTAAYYRRNPDAGGIGGGLSDLDLGANTQAVDRNTQALQSFSQHLLSREVGGPIDKNTGRYPGRTSGISSDIPESKDAISQLYPKRLGIYPQKDELAPTTQQPGGFGGRRNNDIFADPIVTLKQFFSELLSTLRNPGAGTAPFRGEGGGQTGSVNTSPVAKLDLRVDSSTQLIVDGRVLANIVKPYLTSDLLRTQQSQGVVTRRFVV